MPVSSGPTTGPDPEQSPSPQEWGRSAELGPPTPSDTAPSTPESSRRRRFSGAHLAVTGVASLLVGVLATTLVFTVADTDGDDGSVAAASSDGSDDSDDSGGSGSLADALEEPVADDSDDLDFGDDTIGVGDGFTVTTWDGIEIETYVHDFSVDEACTYGQPGFEPQKEPDTRIVQLTMDVNNLGTDTYFIDRLMALSADGYTQPAESAFMYCNEPNDGANRWSGSGSIDGAEKKLLYGAFEVQPDATQLVLATSGNGRMLIDIPAPSSASGDGAGAPQPTPAAG